MPALAAAGGQRSTGTGAITASGSAPDLIITSVTWTGGSGTAGAVIEGDHIVFTAVIKNIGTAATVAGRIHDVAFEINSATVAWSDNSTASLAVGASRTLTANGGPLGVNYWTAGTAATYTMLAIVNSLVYGALPTDPPHLDRIYEETNLANNTNTQSITTTAAAGGGPPPPASGDVSTGAPASQIIAHFGLGDYYATFSNHAQYITLRSLGGVGIANAGTGFSGWTPNLAAATEPNQRSIIDNGIVANLAAAGVKTYFGTREDVPSTQGGSDSCMVADWWDDTQWNNRLNVSGPLRQYWKAVHAMGMHGQFRDGEPYTKWSFGQSVGTNAWQTTYGGNSHDQSSTLAKAYQRGRAEGLAILADFGAGSDYVQYVNSDGYFPRGWDEEVQLAVNSIPRSRSDNMTFGPYHVGLFETAQFNHIIMGHAIFYGFFFGIPGRPSVDLDGAQQANILGITSWMSQNYPTAYANFFDHISLSGDHWFDGGADTGEQAALSGGQAQFFATSSNKYNRFGWILYDHFWQTDYTTWQTALAAGASTTTVDTNLPQTIVSSITRSGAGVTVSGYGQHAHGVTAIAWSLYDATGSSTPGTGNLISNSIFPHTVSWISGVRGEGIGLTRSSYTGTVASAASGTWLDVSAWTLHGQHHVVRVAVP